MSSLVNISYWKWDTALPKEFCHAALEQLDWNTSEIGSVSTKQGTFVNDPSYRINDNIWQHFMQPLGCIARRYTDEANHASEWEYALEGQEHTQICRYKGENTGHYDWHTDSYPPKNGIQRKLTCVILLNDPSEFEGGILQLKDMEDDVLLKQQGSIVVFPSFIEHRVTPVTKGVRYTAVSWAYGPSFR